MFKTGNIFVDLFSQVVIFFPLLPVIIVLVRRIYQKEVLTFLLILCLLNFSQDLTLLILQSADIKQSSVKNIFSLLGFVVIIQIFKPVLKSRQKEIVNILTIAILSAMVTYYIVKGPDQKITVLDIMQNGLVVFLTAYCLVGIVRHDNLRIFYSPIFWVATGTLFYFVINMLFNIIDTCCLQLKQSVVTDKTLLLNIANVARYFFYTLAALLYDEDEKVMQK